MDSSETKPNPKQSNSNKLLNKSHGVKVGRTLLTPKFKDSILPKINTEMVSNITSKKWEITLTQQWSQILSEVLTTKCQALYILIPRWQPQKAMLFRSISNPIFSDLKTLSLTYFNLVSIEGIEFLHMEKLEDLQICRNLITNFKPLSKTNWSNFRRLESHGNHGLIQELNRVKLKPQSYELKMDLNFEWIQIQDPRILMKLECSELTLLKISTYYEGVIYRKNMYEKLKDRFKKNSGIYWQNNFIRSILN